MNNSSEIGGIRSRIASTTRQRWFYRFVIAAIYLSALDSLLRGMARTVSPTLEILVVGLTQPLIYVPPLLFAWYGTHDRRFVLLLAVVVFLILSSPLRIQGDLLSYLLGFKLYFACLFYIPIIKYLSKSPAFERAFLKHMFRILIAYSIWAAVELVSTIYVPAIALRMKSFALSEEQAMGLGRPIGMALDYQTGAFAVAVFCVLLLLQKRYVWYSLLLGLSFFLGLRTWFFAAFVTSALVMGTRASIGKTIWIIGGAVLFAGFYLAARNYIESYLVVFGGEGSSGQIIYDLFISDGWFLFTHGGLLPNGFLRVGASPIFGEMTDIVPHQFFVNEIAILRMHYEMGGIVTLMWLVIMYFPFLSRGLTFYRNQYMVILFFSSIGFVHHLTVLKPFILIFLIFCSIQTFLKQELPVKSKRFRRFGVSNGRRPIKDSSMTT